MRILSFIALFLSTLVVAQTPAVSQKVSIDNKPEETFTVTITVTNIRSTKGSIRFKFHNDSTPFPHDTGFKKIVVPKSQMKGDSLTVVVSGLKKQHMAIALHDDENDDNELQFGWFLPKEGHAFSDYYHTVWRRPVYEDFRFYLEGDKSVVMKVKYY